MMTCNLYSNIEAVYISVNKLSLWIVNHKNGYFFICKIYLFIFISYLFIYFM